MAKIIEFGARADKIRASHESGNQSTTPSRANGIDDSIPGMEELLSYLQDQLRTGEARLTPPMRSGVQIPSIDDLYEDPLVVIDGHTVDEIRQDPTLLARYPQLEYDLADARKRFIIALGGNRDLLEGLAEYTYMTGLQLGEPDEGQELLGRRLRGFASDIFFQTSRTQQLAMTKMENLKLKHELNKRNPSQ